MATMCAALVLVAPAPQAVARDVAAEPADLSVTNAVSDPAPVIGSQVTFTVTVSNAGPAAAQRVKVRDRLPDGYTLSAPRRHAAATTRQAVYGATSPSPRGGWCS